ncbi:hypothetical protein [Streptomyces sp. NPDC002402]
MLEPVRANATGSTTEVDRDRRAARAREAFEGRLKTAAAAGLKDARRSGNRSWERLRSDEVLTAENVRMDTFFEQITRKQFEAELWEKLIKALETSRDSVTTWHEQMAQAERAAQGQKGGMGHPVADARRHLWLEANANFAAYAADSFRRVS